jgi:hypothetical protein
MGPLSFMPNPAEYHVVFDVARTGVASWWLASIVAVIVGVMTFDTVAYFLTRASNRPYGDLKAGRWQSTTVVISAFASLIPIAMVYAMHARHAGLVAAEESHASTVEGIVSQFKSLPKLERFCVSGSCFAYSDYILDGGFNNMRSHGGPIHEGVRVRVKHVNGVIVRLEIMGDEP